MRIGLIGYGRVGQAVSWLLERHAGEYARRLGEALELTTVLCRDTLRERERPAPDGALYTDEERDFFAREHDLVVDCAAHGPRAEALVLRAVEGGCDVVTANQTLIATRGEELFALAEARRVRIGFEGALAGGLPLTGALVHGMGANRVTEFAALLSATCNAVLTKMERDDVSFSEALAAARGAGITHPDTAHDVSGRDTAEKLAIVASVMYQRRVNVERIRTTGIDRLTEEDQRLARELGHTIRLVARAQETHSGVYLRVAPMLVDRREPIASVLGARCAAFLVGDACGRVMMTGEGAGAQPAASAVVSDILRIGALRSHRGPGRLNAWPVGADELAIAPAGETIKRFYVRIPVTDHETGVRAFLDHLRRHETEIRTLHELAGMLVMITEPTSRHRLDDVLDSAPSSGLSLNERVTLRVYTPEWAL
ncbi:MAG: homoserine dehydrogenase [Phycisphaerales bacterium]